MLSARAVGHAAQVQRTLKLSCSNVFFFFFYGALAWRTQKPRTNALARALKNASVPPGSRRRRPDSQNNRAHSKEAGCTPEGEIY